LPNLFRIDGPDASATSSAINRLQNKTADQFAALDQLPLARSRRLIGVAIGTSATTVYHGLGRRLQGWFVTRLSVNTNVWESASQSDITSTINLQAGSAATVDLIVF
jgi:hypothetical protein